MFSWLGRALGFVLRRTAVHDRDASNRCLPPYTHEQRAPITRLLPVHRHPELLPERILDRLRLPRPRYRMFHDIRNALADRRGAVGSFLP